MNSSEVTFKAKCTTCKKVWTLTPLEVLQAKAMGVPFSPCCYAVATVTEVKVRRGK
jgi:hypothetical protein